jgi:hypothetical protein
MTPDAARRANQSAVAANPLQRALIEKAGHDNGFEHVLAAAEAITLASARHRTRAVIFVSPVDGFDAHFQSASPALLPELRRGFAHYAAGSTSFHTATLADLALLLRRAASLSQALPNQAEQDYQTAVKQALARLLPENRNTEVERLVRQRVGQDRYRNAMLDYWGGACAVTGVDIPEVLRASHAKPWAECEGDGERLDVFNGFLLTANLDALFDRFLLSFDDAGQLLIAPHLTQTDLRGLGIQPDMKLRWLSDEHRVYLHWHHDRFLPGK